MTRARPSSSAALGIAAVEAALAPEQVRSAAEVFLTPRRGIIPVTSVDGRRIGDGRRAQDHAPARRVLVPARGRLAGRTRRLRRLSTRI